MNEVVVMGTRSGKTAQSIAEAYKQGFQEGLKAAKNKPEAYWIKKQVDYRHYHYYCSKCGCCSKYKKSNYCPDCGRKMEDYIYAPRNIDRDSEIVELRSKGKTLEEIGNNFGLTKERIRQIIKENKR